MLVLLEQVSQPMAETSRHLVLAMVGAEYMIDEMIETAVSKSQGLKTTTTTTTTKSYYFQLIFQFSLFLALILSKTEAEK